MAQLGARYRARCPLMALLGSCVMSDLSPHCGQSGHRSGRAHLAILAGRPTSSDMSCEDSKRARHHQRQAAYELHSSEIPPADQLALKLRDGDQEQGEQPTLRA
jgi:hypothetical protein